MADLAADLAACKALLAKANADIARLKYDAVERALWESGLNSLCYHFGNCSDVMGDCWMPCYKAHGLKGLKEMLRYTAKQNKHSKDCSGCEDINYLTDS